MMAQGSDADSEVAFPPLTDHGAIPQPACDSESQSRPASLEVAVRGVHSRRRIQFPAITVFLLVFGSYRGQRHGVSSSSYCEALRESFDVTCFPPLLRKFQPLRHDDGRRRNTVRQRASFSRPIRPI